MHNCYFDEEYDDYEDYYDDDDDLDYDINEDDLIDEEIPITNDIEKIHINNEDQFADDDNAYDKHEYKEDDKPPQKEETKKEPIKEELKKEESPQEQPKKCGLANLFP